jgi:hypothetical protein
MNAVIFPHRVRQIYTLPVSNMDKLLLFAMLSLKADRGEVCCPVSEMEKLGFDETTLKKSLKSLIEGGYLRRTYPGGLRKNPHWLLTCSLEANKGAALPPVLSSAQGGNRSPYLADAHSGASSPVSSGGVPPKLRKQTNGDQTGPLAEGDGYTSPVFSAKEKRRSGVRETHSAGSKISSALEEMQKRENEQASMVFQSEPQTSSKAESARHRPSQELQLDLANTSFDSRVKGGVKPGQCGGVKIGQSIGGGCCGIAG